MASSIKPAKDPAPPHAAALSLLNEVRAAFGFSAIANVDVEEVLARELVDALPLLTMLTSMLRNDTSQSRLDDVKLNWNKALRRRNWTALPGLDAAQVRSEELKAQSHNEPVRKLLACFGCGFDACDASETTLVHARVLSAELLRDVEALRTLPLPRPHRYAEQFVAIVQRWNAFAERFGGLPRIDTQDI